jgi:beta-glucuronidase
MMPPPDLSSVSTHRTFETAPTRRRRTLDGIWEFVTDPDDEGLAAGYHERFPDDCDEITVPSAWNATSDYYDYEGVAWYHRTVERPESGPTRVAFHGVCHDATVWIDGERVADHYGGYTPFEAVADLEAGVHDVVVRADSTRDDRSVPRPGTDWFPYGGITREVVVESLPERSVDDLTVDYDLDGHSADVTVTVGVRNLGDAAAVPIRAEVGDATTEREVTVDPGVTPVALSLELDVERWSPDAPSLYEVRAAIGSGPAGDERRERVGFRTVEVTDSDVLVNGDAVEFRAVNRHEDHPEWGHAQPARLQELDLNLVDDAGLNAVRTSHYPNHPRFLDRCDERGVLVIEEIPYWQFDGDRFGREGVLDRGKAMLREMVDRDHARPSVVAWSVTNECANEEDGVVDATRELAAIARERDPNGRPVTLASNNYHPDGDGTDRCLAHVDFVCANAYPGWYAEGAYANVLAAVREDYPDKPVVLSEFGAGAVAGERTRDGAKWSESFQADFLEDAIETARETEYVAGFAVWQFCDTRTDPRNWATRPKTKNNKGILDEYRRPKEAYHRIRGLLDGE